MFSFRAGKGHIPSRLRAKSPLPRGLFRCKRKPPRRTSLRRREFFDLGKKGLPFANEWAIIASRRGEHSKESMETEEMIDAGLLPLDERREGENYLAPRRYFKWREKGDL